jgi:hypothetical protein
VTYARVHDESIECWCEPAVEAQPNGAFLVTHRREDIVTSEAIEEMEYHLSKVRARHLTRGLTWPIDADRMRPLLGEPLAAALDEVAHEEPPDGVYVAEAAPGWELEHDC